jgi:hypothetical protein
MALKATKFDAGILKKLTDPKAAGDLNTFLEKMPQNAGQTVLIAAGIAWAMAGAAGLFTSIQAKELTELRSTHKEAAVLTPVVPLIKDVPISNAEVSAFVEKVKDSYKGLYFQVDGSTIIITADNPLKFNQFREAISHMQNGGSGWRVSLSKLCVGRECDENHKLAVALSVNKVSVENPAK